MPTRLPKRRKRTLIAAESASAGRIGALRASIPTSKVSVSVPNAVQFCVIKNVGTNVVRINFGTNTNNDYWTMAANAVTPVIGLGDGVIINAIAITAASTIEVIYW